MIRRVKKGNRVKRAKKGVFGGKREVHPKRA